MQMNFVFFIECHQEILLHLDQYQAEKRKRNRLPACQVVMPMGVKKCLCFLLEGQKILNAFMEKFLGIECLV